MADDHTHRPPESWEDARQRDWPESAKNAWRVLHEARPGDTVLFADRAQPLEVTDRWTDDDGLAHLTVAGPRGGEYQVNERYGSHGEPKFSSDIGRALDLRWVERQPLPRGLTEAEFESLVETLADRGVDSYLRLDYADFYTAVEDVVDDWAEQVSFHEWPGYDRDEWEEGDATAIFRSVLEHADRLPDVGTPHQDIEQTPKNQAKLVLTEAVSDAGKAEAERQLIHDTSSYNDVVNQLAHQSIERYERKSYSSARNAVRDTVSNFIDDHGDLVYQGILDHAPMPVDDDLYDGYTAEEVLRERAFDTLDRDTWDTVAAIQRSRNEHDPTARGLTREQYMDVVDALTEKTLRRHGVNDRGLIRTTAAEVIEEWADKVTAHEWEGHRHRVWAADDPDDIFASAVMHGENEPIHLNPFTSDAERAMAEQVLLADVTEAADRARDHAYEGEPVPANEYLRDELGIDMTFSELQDEDPDSVAEFLAHVFDGLEGDEMGWTFVDELVAAGGTVPFLTNEWVLVDYGIVREGQRSRKLAWFHRETGDVLVMSGMADAPPEDEEWGYNEFTVARMRYLSDDAPDYLLTDVGVDEALRFVYDYVDAERSDMKVIEHPNGDRWIIDAVESTDINTGGVLDSLVPNFSLPGPDLTEADLFTTAEDKIRGMGKFTRRWSTELSSLAKFGVLSLLPYRASKFLKGIRVAPNIDSNHGVGLSYSMEYGASPHEEGVGGKMEGDVNVRKPTIKKWGSDLVPEQVENIAGPGSRSRQLVSEGVNAQHRIQRRWRQVAYPIDREMLRPDGDPEGNADGEYTRDIPDLDAFRAAGENLSPSRYAELKQKMARKDVGWNDFLRMRAFMFVNERTPADEFDRADGYNHFWEMFDETPKWSWTREALASVGILTPDRDTKANEQPLPGWETLTEGASDYRQDRLKQRIAEEADEDVETVADWDEDEIKENIGEAQLNTILAETNRERTAFQSALASRYGYEYDELWEMDEDDLRDEIGEQEFEQLQDEVGELSSDKMLWQDIEGDGVPLGNLFMRAVSTKDVLRQGSKRLPVGDWSLQGENILPEIDKPSFAAWREKRFGPEAQHPHNPPQPEQRARYYRDVDRDYTPDPHEVMGTSEVADEQALGAMHDTPDELGDYNQASYLGAEFGNSFEDVAAKFNQDGNDDSQVTDQ